MINSPKAAVPSSVIAAPVVAADDFGRITNTLNDGRAFQFSLQFAF